MGLRANLLPVAVAMVVACAAALLAIQGKAEAAFPGQNGKLVMSYEVDFDGGDSGIYAVNPDGSGAETLTVTEHPFGDPQPAVSPDGTRIAFSRCDETSNLCDVYAMDADGTGVDNLTDNSDTRALSPAWSPDGSKIAFVEEGALYVMEPDGSGEEPLARGSYPANFFAAPAWSPDGTKIAFSDRPDAPDGQTDVYAMDADGSGLAKLTDDPAHDDDPEWSPDGTQIAFSSSRDRIDGGFHLGTIYTMDADGSEERKVVTAPPPGEDMMVVGDYHPAWSPDGTRIAFTRQTMMRDGTWSVWAVHTMDADGSGLSGPYRPRTARHAFFPSWQPLRPAGTDPVPPETTVISGPSGALGGAVATLDFVASEPGSSFECALDGAPFSPCEGPKRYAGLPEGAHAFRVRAVDAAGNADPTPARRAWSVDATPPVVNKAPTRGLVAGQGLALGDPAVPVNVRWSAVDGGGSGVARYQLQRSTNGGAFSGVALPSERSTDATPFLGAGKTHRYRVRAQDEAGNWGGWAQGPAFVVDLRQEGDGAVTYSGPWSAKSTLTASSGSVKHASAAGARARFAFTGKHVAWVASTGNNRGKAEVWVDGAKVATVDQYARTARPRTMLFTKAWPAPGNHTLEIRATGTKNAASRDRRVDVDAFVVLR